MPEILLVDSDSCYAELHRRQEDQWSSQTIAKPGETIALSSIDAESRHPSWMSGWIYLAT